MTLEERIKYDITELKKYFEIISNSIQLEPEWSYLNASARFNMVSDIYGCLEFWLVLLCDYHNAKQYSNLSHKDIRGKNDLSAYNKYLEKVVGIEMVNVQNNYCELQNLRRVRNAIVHGGAHTSDEKLGNIRGIELAGTLIIVSGKFIESSLINAENYLVHIANA